MFTLLSSSGGWQPKTMEGSLSYEKRLLLIYYQSIYKDKFKREFYAEKILSSCELADKCL